MPEILFRFRSLHGDSKTYVRKSIMDSEIYFSAPEDLNDPYDCQIALDPSGTDREWLMHCKYSLKQAALHSGRHTRFMDRHKAASQWMRDKRHKKINGVEFGRITNSFGIACFSATLDNQLMWSHYADNHRGICLMYMPCRDSAGLFQDHHEVRYSDDYPVVRILDIPKVERSVVEGLLLTKSKAWQYESEYRLVKPYGARTCFKYHPRALVAVILGARISREDAEEVTEWATTHPARPILHKAELQLGRFGVRIDTNKSR